MKALRVRMGLDQPIPVQLVRFFGQCIAGDLGTDLFSRRSVTSIVLENLPYTLSLIAAGSAGRRLLGIPLGCYSAIRRNSFIDKLTGVISVGTISIPSFVVGDLCDPVLRHQARLVAGDRRRRARRSLDQAVHLIMPALRPRTRLGRLSLAHRARLDARGHGRKPYPHGARLRSAGVPDRVPMRCALPSCRPSRCSRSRSAACLSSAVFVETDLRPAGHRQAHRRLPPTCATFPSCRAACCHRGAVRARHADLRPPHCLARPPCPFNPLTSARRAAPRRSPAAALMAPAARRPAWPSRDFCSCC